MGTTLQNGVYLPNEGERNCYAGLKTNWEILDQKVADVTALQQAVAGALHREIVASLPTTDIDPNTIYMILSGTSATENVYNEFMYVNNAWELIGTSATDLTNYYTKGDVDGLLLLKANASDLTSHTGDTTIHVTASDKSKWNTVALIKQLRLVNAQVGSATTIAFANIDDTNGIKVGDKCMDLDAKMFEITAVDTTNQTVTVGSALIDLALDGDVVHTSGVETVGGFKQFANIRATNSIKGINLENTTTDLNNCYSDFASSDGSRAGNIQYYYCNTDSGTANISNLPEAKAFVLTSITTRLLSNSLYVKQILINSNSKTFVRYCSNSTWSSWVNETDSEYVHKSGNETVGGNKTFVNGTTLNDWLYFTNALVTKGTIPQSSVTPYRIYFGSGTNYANSLFNIDTTVSSTGAQILTFRSAENVVNGGDTRLRIIYDPTLTQPKCVKFQGDCLPVVNNTYECGNNDLKWKSINGINPGALSLPDLSNGIDISSYITDLTGASNINKYKPSVNGWISIGLSGADFIEVYIPSSLMGGTFTKSTTNNYSQAFMPVIANKEVRIALKGSSVSWAKFYPCQGNV